MAYSEHDLNTDELKELTRIKRIMEKYELELDKDTEEIVKYVIRGHSVSGISKMLTKEWAINKLLQMWGEPTLSPAIKQRAFEFMCDLLGHTPKTSEKSTNVMDIVIGETK